MKKLLFMLTVPLVLFILSLALAACDVEDSTVTTTTSDTTTTTSVTTTTTTATEVPQIVKRVYTVDGVVIDSVDVIDKNAPHIDVPARAHYDGAWELLSIDNGTMYYKAVYMPTEYTVAFVADGVTVDTQVYTIEDKSITVPNVPTKQHYDGVWESYVLDSGNKTVNSRYTPKTYTVTFVANGSTVGSRSYTVENRNLSVPNVPARQHYDGAWESYVLDGGNKTVNAEYTPKAYTISFAVGGVVVATETYTVEDKSVKEPTLSDTLYGYYGEGETYWESYTLDCTNKTVNAVTTKQPQAKYELYENSYYTVTGYNSLVDGKLEILAEYLGKPVEVINQRAFYDDFKIVSVHIPSSIRFVGSSAFSGCLNLESIYAENIEGWLNITFQDAGANPLFNAYKFYINGETSAELVIPEGVTSIKPYAFHGCISIRRVTIPSSMKSIGENAFGSCDLLIEVYNRSNINITAGSQDYGKIGYYALNVYTPVSGQSKISEDENGLVIYVDGPEKIVVGYNGKNPNVLIPNGVTRIRDFAFANCDYITDITVPSSVVEMGHCSFLDCSKLESVHIKDIRAWCNISFISAQSSPFFYADKLYINGTLATDIVIPDDVTEIKNYAFYSIDSVVSAKLPSGLKVIGNYLFYDCQSLASIEIPSGVTNIGQNAFAGTAITSITIPSGVTSIGHAAFENCKQLQSVVLSSTLESIEMYAFRECVSLQSIIIPKNVTIIKMDAFDGCSGLKSVEFKKNDGWVTYLYGPSNGVTEISSTDLEDTSIAAEYLTETYCKKTWSCE